MGRKGGPSVLKGGVLGVDLSLRGFYNGPAKECSSVGRATVSKTVGRRFESCRSCQYKNPAIAGFLSFVGWKFLGLVRYVLPEQPIGLGKDHTASGVHQDFRALATQRY